MYLKCCGNKYYVVRSQLAHYIIKPRPCRVVPYFGGAELAALILTVPLQVVRLYESNFSHISSFKILN